ncbi:MAG TPA: 50S ribosomal protein L24 [bacterium]|nr:50S ribosomal protein L24 [bacterium]
MERIKKGDVVKVISGNHKGQKGKVLKLLKEKNRIIVEKVNLIKKHSRPSMKNQAGGIVEKEGSIPISNVMLVCPKCDNVTRKAVQILENGKKIRICKKCKENIDK